MAKRFKPEFKAEAVRLVLEENRSHAAVAPRAADL
jgi:transposase-like protein